MSAKILLPVVLLTTATGCYTHLSDQLHSGNKNFDLGNYEQAILDYSKFIRHAPEFIVTYMAFYNRGLAKYYIEDYQGAIKDFNKAIKLSPRSTRTLAVFHRGNAKAQTGDIQGAIADYNKTLEDSPDYKPAITALNRIRRE